MSPSARVRPIPLASPAPFAIALRIPPPAGDRPGNDSAIRRTSLGALRGDRASLGLLLSSRAARENLLGVSGKVSPGDTLRPLLAPVAKRERGRVQREGPAGMPAWPVPSRPSQTARSPSRRASRTTRLVTVLPSQTSAMYCWIVPSER